MKFEKFLVKTAVDAGDILLQYFTKSFRVTRKRNAGIVTEADHKAEALVMKRIRRDFPQASILTEESGKFLKDGANMRFVIDPLDGTTNFAHGFPWFCVSLGLEIDGVPFAGVVYNPFFKELFIAERKKGAYRNGRRIQVSKTKAIKESLIGTGFYYSKGLVLQEELNIFWKMNERAMGIRRPGAAALDLACVAAGRYDGFWERRLSPWDVAAGIVLVEEAGGKISDYAGKATDSYGKEMVASNGIIHRTMVNTIQSGL